MREISFYLYLTLIITIAMPEFVPVIVAALLLLATLLAFVQVAPEEKVPYQKPVKYVIYEEEEFPESEKVVSGFIGRGEGIKHVVIARNFVVSYFSGEQKILSMSNITVANGLMNYMDRKISFDVGELESVERGKISIEVFNTNLYGPLIIYLNGKEIFSNYTPIGRYEIAFNISLLREKNNLLEIGCGSSGWKLWAPTMYILSLNLSVDKLQLKKRTYYFILGEEVQSLTGSRLVFSIDKRKGEGNLIVRINGKEIYRGKDVSPLIDFSWHDVALRKGENIIEFLVERNTEISIR
jgi:hypothetical protein